MYIKVILVLIAMEKEARPFIDALNLIEEVNTSFRPCKIFKGSVKDASIIVATNGIDVRHVIESVGIHQFFQLLSLNI